MSYFHPRPGRTRQRGRPKNSGRIKPPEEKSTVPTKLSPLLVDIVQPERRVNESISDTILRLLKEKGLRIGRLEKKVVALEGQLEVQYAYTKEPNK